MKPFQLISQFSPAGDQPKAIRELAEGVKNGLPAQVLLGVTGSGKTFTLAGVIEKVGKPTLVLSHNKTLAAQLYQEFKSFFPENAVEYYVSYYDYYQPEAYIASTDTYIEKDLAINEDIDRLRLAATSSLLSGRKDVIVVSSVSCIYGMGNPAAFYENVIELRVGKNLGQSTLLNKLVGALYVRNDLSPRPGTFRVKGDTVDIFLAYAEEVVRVVFWDDEIDAVETIDPDTGYRIMSYDVYKVYPANLFITSQDTQQQAIRLIQDDLMAQVELFNSEGKTLEAKRLQERVEYDLEMIRQLGHCSGIENYSRYFDGRQPGERPYCLLDFFPDDFLLVVDESHVTVPQIRAMYGGDRSRKEALVNYGFRLPAALDNRPLTFEEFHEMTPQVIYVSATPADYEMAESEGVVVEQIIRPTGLLDPMIEVRDTEYPVDDLMEEIRREINLNSRVLVTTLTKRMAEELTDYLLKSGVKATYIHSEVDTLSRVQIMDDLRSGVCDVLVGVNLLREGLDLPEVSLVAILDADKEGFLRSARSLTQTVGRAARNVRGRVIMYAHKITESMQQAIDETMRHRQIQQAFNIEHHIEPKQIVKPTGSNALSMGGRAEEAERKNARRKNSPFKYAETAQQSQPQAMAAEDAVLYDRPGETVEEKRERLTRMMKQAAAEFDFIAAARLRDELLKILPKEELKG